MNAMQIHVARLNDSKGSISSKNSEVIFIKLIKTLLDGSYISKIKKSQMENSFHYQVIP